MSGIVFTKKVAAVVLAAGASTRMSATKQLLPWKDTTLLEYVVRSLEAAGSNQIFVVLGSHRKEILKQTDLENVHQHQQACSPDSDAR